MTNKKYLLVFSISIILVVALGVYIIQLPQETDVWISPIICSDLDNEWRDESFTIDNDTSTYAQCFVGTYSWSGYLQFTMNEPVHSSKIRVWTYLLGDMVEVDVHVDEEWTTIFRGPLGEGAWDEIMFAEVDFTELRMRFHNEDISPFVQVRLGEIQVQKS